MKITDIIFRKFFQEGSNKAICSVVFDGKLAVHGISIVNVRDHLFVVMPNRKNPDGTYSDVVHPINGAFRVKLEEKILDAYNEAIAKTGDNCES